MTGFDGCLSFADDDGAKLTETTRTILDNCFVDLTTGFVNFISDLSVATSDIGFVSTTDVIDIGAGPRLLLAFGGSVLGNLIDI